MKKSKIKKQESILLSMNNIDYALFESMGEGICILNKNKKVHYMNSSAEKLLGVSLKDACKILYSKVLRFEKDTEDALDFHFIDNVYKTGKIVKIPQDFIALSGKHKRFYVAGFVSPIFNENKEDLIGVIISLHDITKEKNTQTMQENFVNLAAHQLRTPITAVRWSLEMLKNDESFNFNEQQKMFIADSYKSAVRTSDLVNSLLNISRIEANKLGATPEEVDVIEFCKEKIQHYSSLIQKKGHTIKFLTKKKKNVVVTDKTIFNEVFSNLLSNSIKYTPENGIIKVKIEENKKELLISIDDNGIGIPEHQKEKMFEKFFRADNAVAKQQEGTGLGLVIVKKLVGILGGRIWFDSKENVGTKFTFTLPKKGLKAKQGVKTLS